MNLSIMQMLHFKPKFASFTPTYGAKTIYHCTKNEEILDGKLRFLFSDITMIVNLHSKSFEK